MGYRCWSNNLDNWRASPQADGKPGIVYKAVYGLLYPEEDELKETIEATGNKNHQKPKKKKN